MNRHLKADLILSQKERDHENKNIRQHYQLHTYGNMDRGRYHRRALHRGDRPDMSALDRLYEARDEIKADLRIVEEGLEIHYDPRNESKRARYYEALGAIDTAIEFMEEYDDE